MPFFEGPAKGSVRKIMYANVIAADEALAAPAVGPTPSSESKDAGQSGDVLIEAYDTPNTFWCDLGCY